LRARPKSGIDNVYYNGNKAADFVTVEGVKKLGLEKVPPIVTRGVVLDHLGIRSLSRRRRRVSGESIPAG
jgi:hypothetical protein